MAQEAKLPDTSCAILGLLTFGRELSGYDLVKAVEGSIGFFWSPAKSQIYAELKRLVASGFATEREVEQENRPDKRVYTITAAGEAVLQQWLTSPEEEPEEIKSTFLLKVFFGHRMSRDEVLEKVREYRTYCQTLLATFEGIETQIEAIGGPAGPQLYPWVTLSYGMSHAKAGIAWSDDMLSRLGKKKGGKR